MLLYIALAILEVATSMNVALRTSEDERQYAKCSKSEETFDYEHETIKQSSADMRLLRNGLINYCELRGTFIFYSQENFQAIILRNTKLLLY